MPKDIAKRIDAELESIAANPVKQENRYEPDNLNNLKVTQGSDYVDVEAQLKLRTTSKISEILPPAEINIHITGRFQFNIILYCFFLPRWHI